TRQVEAVGRRYLHGERARHGEAVRPARGVRRRSIAPGNLGGECGALGIGARTGRSHRQGHQASGRQNRKCTRRRLMRRRRKELVHVARVCRGTWELRYAKTLKHQAENVLMLVERSRLETAFDKWADENRSDL